MTTTTYATLHVFYQYQRCIHERRHNQYCACLRYFAYRRVSKRIHVHYRVPTLWHSLLPRSYVGSLCFQLSGTIYAHGSRLCSRTKVTNNRRISGNNYDPNMAIYCSNGISLTTAYVNYPLSILLRKLLHTSFANFWILL